MSSENHTTILQHRECIFLVCLDKERGLWKIKKTEDRSVGEIAYGSENLGDSGIVHCAHTSDSDLVGKVVHHALRDCHWEEDWSGVPDYPEDPTYMGDPAHFAEVISCVVNFIDGLIAAGEAIVGKNTAAHIAGILTKKGTAGLAAPQAGPSVIINGGNVTINFRPTEDTADQERLNLAPYW
jgi:hypothetical protein